MIRTIYINPGDVLNFKFIQNKELPRNAKEFRYQLSSDQESVLLFCQSGTRIYYDTPMVHIERRDWSKFINKDE